jgi:hypothetical protein
MLDIAWRVLLVFVSSAAGTDDEIANQNKRDDKKRDGQFLVFLPFSISVPHKL